MKITNAMFRTLLMAVLAGLCFNVQAQVQISSGGKVASNKPTTVKHATHTPNVITGNETDNRPATSILDYSGERSTVGTQIGNSTYDLQTNYGVCRRVYVESNGTVHGI